VRLASYNSTGMLLRLQSEVVMTALNFKDMFEKLIGMLACIL